MTECKQLRIFLLALTMAITMLITFSNNVQGADVDVRAYDLRKGTGELVHPDPDRACRLSITAENGPAWGRIDIYTGFAKHKKLVGRLDFNLESEEQQVYEFEQGLRIGVFDIHLDDGHLSIRTEQPTKPGVYPPSWAKTQANRLEIFPDADMTGPGNEKDVEGAIKKVSLHTAGNTGSVVAHAGSAIKILKIGDRPAPPSALFDFMPGLADDTWVSLESCNRPKHFIRVTGEQVRFQKYEADAAFREESTFRVVPGLADPSYASFESFTASGRFLQHANGRMTAGPATDDATRRAATFLVKPFR
jgi:hypothetical protein